MMTFDHDGLSLRYIDEGTGPVVLLIHGFASNIEMNWIGPGWVAFLADRGYRVVAIDNRGHGKSDKPHDPDAYQPRRMVDDAVALLDRLDVDSAIWFGYSMGARIGAFAALRRPARLNALVLGGLGMGLVTGLDGADGIAEALLADDPTSVTGARPQMFRTFADKTGSDRRALAACIQTSREVLAAEDVARIECPALVAVGSRDDLAGSAEGLAKLIPNGRTLDIPNRDHMLAVGDAVFRRGVADFLQGLNNHQRADREGTSS